MIPKAHATVTELALTPIIGHAMLRLVRLDAAQHPGLPPPGRAVDSAGCRIRWVEPGHWLATGQPAALAAIAVDVDLARFDVSGSLTGMAVIGEGWRELLMIGGVFDAEARTFGPGCIARTIMHHTPLLIDCIGDDRVEAWVPPSHAAEFFDFWHNTVARRGRRLSAPLP